MKIALTFLRIALDEGPHYRLAVHKHYESGHGNAGVDPRALAATAFGTIAQNISVIAQWLPFDFERKGGMILDPKILSDAMIEDLCEGDPQELITRMEDVIARVANIVDQIPDNEHEPDRAREP